MRGIFLALVLCLLGCIPPAYPPARVTLALDTTRLSSVQESVVREAAESIVRQTNGCIQFNYGGGTRVIPMVPPDKYDHDPKYPSNTLGMTTQGEKIELSFGKFANRDIAVLVTAHELLHGVGIRHVENRYSLMYPNINNARLGFSPQDRHELLVTVGCE